MQVNNGYSKGSKALHWAMAFILISMLFLGLSMVQSLAIWQIDAVAFHKSFGVLALVLVIIRLINKVLSRSPSLPSELPKWQVYMAHTTHIGLYGAMFLMPISGWLMQNADGRSVSFFGWVDLPSMVKENINLYGLFREIHAFVAWLFLAMVFMHIGAALYHGLIKQDGVMSSMLSRTK
jgi:cytochrome b561